MEPVVESNDIVQVYSQVLCSSFNADGSCVCISNRNAFSVYNTNPAKKRFETSKLGGLRVVELRYSSSLVACVPSGDKAGISPRKLILFDCIHNSKLTELTFPSTIVKCQMNNEHLVVSLEGQIYIYDIWTLSLIKEIECDRGGTAVSLCTGTTSILAISQNMGQISVYICNQERVTLLFHNIQAHTSKISLCQISASGQYLATSSIKGTVIKLFLLSTGQLYGQYRRGFHHAEVTSISFCPRDEYLAVGSSSGTVHIFTIKSSVDRTISTESNTKKSDTTTASTVFSSSPSSSSSEPSHSILSSSSTPIRLFQSALGSISSIATEVARQSKGVREAIDPIRADYRIKVPGKEAKFKVIWSHDVIVSGEEYSKPKIYMVTDGGFLYRFRIPETSIVGELETDVKNGSEAQLCIHEEEYNLLDM